MSISIDWLICSIKYELSIDWLIYSIKYEHFDWLIDFFLYFLNILGQILFVPAVGDGDDSWRPVDSSTPSWPHRWRDCSDTKRESRAAPRPAAGPRSCWARGRAGPPASRPRSSRPRPYHRIQSHTRPSSARAPSHGYRGWAIAWREYTRIWRRKRRASGSRGHRHRRVREEQDRVRWRSRRHDPRTRTGGGATVVETWKEKYCSSILSIPWLIDWFISISVDWLIDWLKSIPRKRWVRLPGRDGLVQTGTYWKSPS